MKRIVTAFAIAVLAACCVSCEGLFDGKKVPVNETNLYGTWKMLEPEEEDVSYSYGISQEWTFGTDGILVVKGVKNGEEIKESYKFSLDKGEGTIGLFHLHDVNYDGIVDSNDDYEWIVSYAVSRLTTKSMDIKFYKVLPLSNIYQYCPIAQFDCANAYFKKE